MNDTNFSSILDRQSSDIEKPKPLPVGSYLTVVKGLPKHDKSTKKQTPYVEFTLMLLQPMDDVDMEALEEMGGHSGKSIRATYYITEDAVWRLKEFLDHLGVEEDDLSLRQRIDQAPGRQVLVTLRHEASEDGTSVFARIAKTAAVD